MQQHLLPPIFSKLKLSALFLVKVAQSRLSLCLSADRRTWERPERLEQLAQTALQVRQVLTAPLVKQEPMEQLVRPVQTVQLVLMDKPATTVRQELMVPQVQLVQTEQRVRLVLMERPVKQERMAPLDKLEQMALPVQLELTVQLVLTARPAKLEQTVQLVLTVRLVKLEQMARPVRRVRMARLAKLVPTELLAQPELAANYVSTRLCKLLFPVAPATRTLHRELLFYSAWL